VTILDEVKELILKDLNPQQASIVLSEENLLVRACPGSGKTRVLTYKLAYMYFSNPSSIKRIIAITYTNRAADEIKSRLDFFDIDAKKIWAGTIHQFCLEYIIKPYAGSCQRLKKGFKIIDEYVQQKYIREILSNLNISIPFYEVAKIKTSLNPDMSICEENYSSVVEEYHRKLIENKEIDFDLILMLAYKILMEHPTAAYIIANTIKSIFVDEYQDTNELQYQIIGKITQKNKKILTLFVGDLDQAIYGSLGGVAKSLSEIATITGLSFSDATLNGCYRSTQRIIDYYSYFQEKKYEIISKSHRAEVQGLITLDTDTNKDNIYNSISKIISEKVLSGILPQEICVIAPQWTLLYPLSKKLKEILPDIPFDAPDISPIKVDDMNVFYKLSKLVFTEAGVHISSRKRVASEIINILSNNYNVVISSYMDNFWLMQNINSVKPKSDDGVDHYTRVVNHILKLLNVDRKTYPLLFETFDSFIEKINDRIKRFNLSSDIESFKSMYKEKCGTVITSCHKIKGEEYNTVIAFGILQGMIPYWDRIRADSDSGVNEANKLLYVIASRAKENLYLFAEQGRTTKKGVYQLTDVVSEYKYTYDSMEDN
jgi:superfamily I DNA/RNA helicase